MDKMPFNQGDVVKCRDVGTGTALNLGYEYEVRACAQVGRHWVVQVLGPAGFDLAGSQIWYLARRFVKMAKQKEAVKT